METTCNYLKNACQEIKLESKQNLNLLALIVVLLTLPLSYAVNSITILFFALTALFSFRKNNFRIEKYLIAPIILYLLMVISIFWSQDVNATLKAISKELPLLIFPICFMAMPALDENKKQFVLKYFSFGMFFYMVFYLIKAIIRYLITKNSAVFFYHDLVNEDLNAIHVSVYMSVAFFYFYTKISESNLFKTISFLFAIFIFLLSSKNIIIVFVFLVVFYEFYNFKKSLARKKTMIGLIVMGLLLLVLSPRIRDRFSSEFHSNTSTTGNNKLDIQGNVNYVNVHQAWTQQKFQQNDYFSGTAFRVYQIRIFKEMLQEDPILFTGYGLNATAFKIKEMGKKHAIFSGDSTHDGYQNKNFHNEYIQLFAEMGIFGFLLIVAIVILNLIKGIQSKDFVHISFAVLTISLFLTESFLSRQRGIVFFTIMYCLFNSSTTSKDIKIS
ncbi:O-antigen ligase [Flavobacterium sp. CG_23.5]|uniref:O-antigen ligase family protein n=1 Tax=Flavobacterium sp. CG_23.5 TaxID=2760708 RepID=UPI001AE728A8|nr:O-antigen ligase family protein [Flavobacterium sp. CG_23.5]MBP2283635.1 O-antigen ligase [Flavobacterium sp. CG_23.5]